MDYYLWFINFLPKVKKRERRRKHESLLTEEYSRQIDYLNLFLPEEHRIQSIHFDMARCKKK